MGKNKILTFYPYTSLSMSSLQKEDELLQGILSSQIELSPRKIDKPVILYGAGSLGKMAKYFFDYMGIPFLYVVDKNANQYKTDEYWQNIKIIHPDNVKKTDKKDCLLVVCIVTVPLMELQNELKDNGWEDIAFFYDVSEAYRDRYPLGNGWFLGKFNEDGKKSIKKIFSLLADNISRAYYVQFLAWRKLRIELLFDGLEINKDNRFFIPEITGTLQENEVFVDCGAHKGFVAEKFLKTVNNKYKAIYAIEPDYANFEILGTQLRDIPNTTTIKCALSDKNGEERFSQGFDFASKLNRLGKDNVKIANLDSLNIPATFIKMHLEGGELDALKGAVNTIQKYRPIIAITIYHNPDGVWKIPLFLINTAKNYKYYMRLHSWGGTGAVVYAIPKERSEQEFMAKPLISICIPNYNNAKYLDACIQSALDQEYPNAEIIFVDDNSTDGSLKIAQKYSEKIKIYVNSTNIGQPKNTNKCVELSNGKYIAILHSDDQLLPGFASKLLPLLEQHPKVGMAVGERMVTNEIGTRTTIAPFYNTNCIIPGVKQAKVFMMTSFLPCQVLLRRDVFEKISGVDERYIVNLDGLLWFKCALQGDVSYIQESVSIYRIHQEQTTAQYNRTINHMLEYYGTLTEMFKLAKNIPYLKQFFNDAVKRTAELTVRYCHDVMKGKNYDLAKRYLALATVFDPKIVEYNQYKAIKKCLDSIDNDPYEVHKTLIDTDKPRDRGFSYDPPEGSTIIN